METSHTLMPTELRFYRRREKKSVVSREKRSIFGKPLARMREGNVWRECLQGLPGKLLAWHTDWKG